MDYTISGEQLTISGLDQIKMEDEDGNEVAFPSSKLTFKYYGDL